jgi:hypothetical protein
LQARRFSACPAGLLLLQRICSKRGRRSAEFLDF